MPPEYVLVTVVISAVTGLFTYLLNKPKVNADAITALHATIASSVATIASMNLRLDNMSKTVSEVTRDNGMLAVNIERQAFQIEQLKTALATSNTGWADERKLSDKLLVEIDGLPAKNLKQAAEILKLEQERDGLPDKPAKPDAELTALAADVKDAEDRAGKPSTDSDVLKSGDTVKIVAAKE